MKKKFPGVFPLILFLLIFTQCQRIDQSPISYNTDNKYIHFKQISPYFHIMYFGLNDNFSKCLFLYFIESKIHKGDEDGCGVETEEGPG